MGSQEEEEARKEEIMKETTHLSHAEIVEKLEELSEDKDSDCILVAWIGHGRKLEKEGHSREQIRVCGVRGVKLMCVEEIWKPFFNYEKPKIFLIKACRGNQVDEGIDRDDSRDGSESDILELKKDFLIFHSSPSGYITPLHGEQLIQKFCEVLDNKDSPDLTALMTEANGKAARARDTSRYKQMPEIQSTMTKAIWLKPKPENLRAPLEPTDRIIPENGKALIFTCGNTEGLNGNLRNILGELGFEVETKDISSLSRAEVIEDMETLSQEKEANCVLVAMTVQVSRKLKAYEGWQLVKDVIHVRGGTIPMEDILEPFQRSQALKALAGRPKIFLIQFNRKDVEGEEREDTRSGDAVTPKMPKQADFLVYQLRSARSGEEGSLLIRSISEVLKNAERNDEGIFKKDLMSLLAQVNKKVSDSDNEQIPDITSRLTKPVHFKQMQK